MSILHLPWARRTDDTEGTENAGATTPKTAFVLGGGGNLGAIQVGMLQAVMERGIKPDVVVGCSVGAINAAAVAANPTVSGIELLRDIWISIRDDVICPAGRL